MIVADAEYKSLISKIDSFHEMIDSAMTGYVQCVRYATDNAVKDEKIKGQLIRYANEVTSIKQQFQDKILALECLFDPFVSEIDKEDNILY